MGDEQSEEVSLANDLQTTLDSLKIEMYYIFKDIH